MSGERAAGRSWFGVSIRWAAQVLFYGYVLLLVIAGAWGALFAPMDLDWLIGLDLPDPGQRSRADLLSQYRFLRAVEFGVGVVFLVFRKEVFSVRLLNRLFLVLMGSGILARAISIPIDGSPSPVFYFFLVSETLGMLAIFVHTQRTGFSQKGPFGKSREATASSTSDP